MNSVRNNRLQNKWLIPLLVFAILTISSSFAVFAESSTGFSTETVYSADGNINITVKGNTAEAGENIIFVVTNPGYTPADIADGDSSVIQHQDFIVSEADKSFTYTFGINTEKEIATGLYGIYYGIYPDSVKKAGEAYLFNQTDVKTFIETVCYESESWILNLLSTEPSKLLVDSFEPFKAADVSVIAKKLKAELADFDRSGDEAEVYNNLVKLVKSISVTEAFNNNRKDIVLDENGMLLYFEESGFNDIEKISETSFVSQFNQVVSENGQKIILEKMFGNNFLNPEETYKKFAELTLLYGINNPKQSGYGHVEKLMSDKNCGYLKINISGAFSIERQKAVSEYPSVFESISALETYVNSLPAGPVIVPSRPSTDGVGGGGGGGATRNSYSVSEEYNQQLKGNSAEGRIFDDVPENHWAAQAVAGLKSKGIISGETETTYNPDGYITREAFIKLLCAAAEMTVTDIENYESTPFSDVNMSEWYAPYVCTAYESGSVKGISETVFGVGENISRQDLCTLVYRMLLLDGADVKLSFADSNIISGYAKEAVSALYSKGIVNGYSDSSFKPYNNCTRAEAAQIIFKTLKWGEQNEN